MRGQTPPQSSAFRQLFAEHFLFGQAKRLQGINKVLNRLCTRKDLALILFPDIAGRIAGTGLIAENVIIAGSLNWKRWTQRRR